MEAPMKLLFTLTVLFSALSAHADDQSPIRMANAHGTIYHQVINRSEGHEDVIAQPICQFVATIPVFDIRSGIDFSSDGVLASCQSAVDGNAVTVSVKGKVTIEVWGDKDVKGVGVSLVANGDPAKKIRIPKPLYGYVGSRDLSTRSLMVFLDPTGWNGSPEAPVKEEMFAATIEVDDGN
jgi:hypothetical protein